MTCLVLVGPCLDVLTETSIPVPEARGPECDYDRKQ